VHRCVKFSRDFTVQEIKERWQGLLEDPNTVKICERAVKRLARDECVTAHLTKPKSVLPSRPEVAELSKIPSTTQCFDDPTFASARHFHIWSQLRWFNLLADQRIDILAQNLSQKIKSMCVLLDGELETRFPQSTLERTSLTEEESEDTPGSDNSVKEEAYISGNIDHHHFLYNSTLLQNSQKLIQDPNSDALLLGNNRVRQQNLVRLKKLQGKMDQFKFESDVVGMLEGRFINFEIRSCREITGGFSGHEKKHSAGYLNLSHELDIDHMPESFFKIHISVEDDKSCKLFIRNVTHRLADLSLMVTTNDDAFCLLDGDAFELRHLDMVTILDINFVFHLNTDYRYNASLPDSITHSNSIVISGLDPTDYTYGMPLAGQIVEGDIIGYEGFSHSPIITSEIVTSTVTTIPQFNTPEEPPHSSHFRPISNEVSNIPSPGCVASPGVIPTSGVAKPATATGQTPHKQHSVSPEDGGPLTETITGMNPNWTKFNDISSESESTGDTADDLELPISPLSHNEEPETAKLKPTTSSPQVGAESVPQPTTVCVVGMAPSEDEGELVIDFDD